MDLGMEMTLENPKHERIWKEVKNRLTGLGKKDYVLHSGMVTRAMREIIKGEGGDPEILIPAAMLHDVGWTKVQSNLLIPETDEDKKEAERLHLALAPGVVQEILGSIGYEKNVIDRIINIVVSHKSKNPETKEIECMVDADNLSDTYRESFYSDTRSYNSTPAKTYEFRKKNTFFTGTANKIFRQHLKDRLAEIESGEADNLMKR